MRAADVPWLLRDGEVLASLEIVSGRRRMARRSGHGIEGAVLLPPAWIVHTARTQAPVDVAFCDVDVDLDDDFGGLVVVRTVRMPRWRLTVPSVRARVALEVEAGSFARWGLQVGDELEVKQ